MQRDCCYQQSSHFAAAAKPWAQKENGYKRVPRLDRASEPSISQTRPFHTCSKTFNPSPEPITETRQRFSRCVKADNTSASSCPTNSPQLPDYRQTLRVFWGNEEVCDKSTESNGHQTEFQSYFKPNKSGKICCPSSPPTFAPPLVQPLWLNRPTELSPFYPSPKGVKIKPISKGGIRTNFHRNPNCLTCGVKRDLKILRACHPNSPACRSVDSVREKTEVNNVGSQANSLLYRVVKKVTSMLPLNWRE